jgi:fructose-1,6-bisphosphatase I
MSELITINRHILDTQRKFPHATGTFTGLLQYIATAAKVVAREVRRAGLAQHIGVTGEVNIQGEIQQKLDLLAHDTLAKLMVESGYLAVMGSEEEDHEIVTPNDHRRGGYVVNFDPLDGSSNIDANVPTGTIFSILPRVTSSREEPSAIDCMQTGRRQVAAGYILYGSATMFVYSTGAGTHGFTLDPTIGEFLLTHPDIMTPEYGKYYSVNTGNRLFWSDGVRRFVDDLNLDDKAHDKPFSCRYVGSLVSDFHRNLLYGGIFLYPSDSKKDATNPKPKLRLLYEANPLAFLVEQAGGVASDGYRNILDVQPVDLHQRVPLFIGSRKNVEELESYIKKYDRS